MNSRFRKWSRGIQIGILPLLAVLLVGSVLAGLFPQTAMAQQQRDDLSLRLLSNHYYTEITAGETKVLLLEVKNTGSNAITDIELSAIPPQDWTVDLLPGRITSLNPADSTVIQVTVKTPPNSEKERYEITLRADSPTVHRAASAWMMVEPPEGRWLWIGGILAAVVVAGFVVIFMRFGRD